MGDAVSLNGINSYVAIPDSELINFGANDDFTVETWVRADELQPDTRTPDVAILEKWSGSGGYPFVIRYIRETGQIAAARFDGSNFASVSSTTGLNDTEFHHIAFVKEGELLSLYIDGELEATATDTTTGSTVNGSALNVGRRGNNILYFAGDVDELRIWDRARSQSEIQQTLYATLSGNESNLVGYYPFEDESAIDLTSNGNNGTLINTEFENSLSFVGYVDLVLDTPVTSTPGAIIDYVIQNASATQGTDFYASQLDISTTDGNPPTNSVFIPTGSNSARIYFTALPDAVVEGNEQFQVVGFNQAIALSGSSYIQTDTAPVLAPSDPFTVETWVKIGMGEDDGGIISGGPNHAVGVGEGSVFFIAGRVVNVSSSTLINDGEWHHVAAVYDGASLSLYIDGALDATSSGSVGRIRNLNQFYIGFDPTFNGPPFIGSLDEFRFWSTARSQSEIQATFNTSLSGSENGLEAYYTLNTSTVDGSTVREVTGSTVGTLIDPDNVTFEDSAVLVDQAPTITIIDSSAYIPGLAIADAFNDTLQEGNSSEIAIIEGEWSFQVQLTSEPTANVTVNLSLSEGTGSTESLTFTAANWDVARTVTVSDLGETTSLDLLVTTSSSDSNYSGLSQDFSLVDREEVVKLKVTEGSASVQLPPPIEVGVTTTQEATEGQDAPGLFNISLSSPAPEGGLTIPFSISSEDATIGTDYTIVTSASTLDSTTVGTVTIGEGASNAQIGIVAIDDNVAQGTRKVEVTLGGNQSASFDGNGDYVSLPASAMGGAMTFEAWVYNEDVTRSWARVFDFGNGQNQDNILLGWQTTTGRMAWNIRNGNSGDQQILTDDIFPENEWVHVAATVDESGNAAIYWNGELKASGVINIPQTITRSNQFLGRSNWAVDADFQGSMDEVRIWNIARSQSEIQETYLSPLTGTETGLTTYLNFNDGTATDITGNGNDGTLVGASTNVSDLFYELVEGSTTSS
ncbi:LamG domain-containing protein [Crocosphaera sp. Alani8]|uniref:LamG domain-containing protein n=1 Tax=Crocosphaera sp. Alani8 TaxID=3038952 RepID=UPI00313B803E